MTMAKKASGQNRMPRSHRPEIGDAFLMPLPDGRFGFCHVIDVPGKDANLLFKGKTLVELSSWVGTEAPDLNDPRLRQVLVETSHNSGPNTWRVVVSGAVPESFKRLGTIEPNATKEQVIAIFTRWEGLAGAIYTQWRWEHDREALLRDAEAEIERFKAEQAESAEQERAKLEKMGLEALLKKRRFSQWKGDRPDRAIGACRKACREAIKALIAIGPKPTKRAVAGVVRRCVEQLNSLDEQYDGFIETGEREELCREIDEIVYVAGLRGCDGMADEWREW
jgi:hypothetical protein